MHATAVPGGGHGMAWYGMEGEDRQIVHSESLHNNKYAVIVFLIKKKAKY